MRLQTLTRRVTQMQAAALKKHPANFLLTAEWQAIHATMIQVIAAYPDARLALGCALAQEKRTDWLSLRAAIVQALTPFSEARIAVAAALYAQGQQEKQ